MYANANGTRATVKWYEQSYGYTVGKPHSPITVDRMSVYHRGNLIVTGTVSLEGIPIMFSKEGVKGTITQINYTDYTAGTTISFKPYLVNGEAFLIRTDTGERFRPINSKAHWGYVKGGITVQPTLDS